MTKYNLPIDYTELEFSEKRIVREQYIELQDGRCMYCNSSLYESPSKKISDKEVDKRLFPKDFFNYPIHLQHCHNTGMTEGAVHSYCNAVLWQYDGR